MRKLISAILACTLMTASFASCQPKSSKNKNSEVPTINDQVNGSAEDAFREIYDLIYTPNGGEAFYLYNFPQKVIDIMKSSNTYDTAIKKYNEGQAQYLEAADNKPDIKEITDNKKFSDDQLKAAERYFLAISGQQVKGVTADDIKAIEGYEFRANVTNAGGVEDTDVECIVKLENDGWKLIPLSLDALSEAFSEDAMKEAEEKAAAAKTTSADTATAAQTSETK